MTPSYFADELDRIVEFRGERHHHQAIWASRDINRSEVTTIGIAPSESEPARGDDICTYV